MSDMRIIAFIFILFGVIFLFLIYNFVDNAQQHETLNANLGIIVANQESMNNNLATIITNQGLDRINMEIVQENIIRALK